METATNSLEQKPSQHTPGPWLQCGEHGLTIYALHDNGFGYWRDGKRMEVNRFSADVSACESQGGTLSEAIANARLIAAAPDLLDVLERFSKFPFTHQGPAEGPLATMLKQAKAAIDKAKG